MAFVYKQQYVVHGQYPKVDIVINGWSLETKNLIDNAIAILLKDNSIGNHVR